MSLNQDPIGPPQVDQTQDPGLPPNPNDPKRKPVTTWIDRQIGRAFGEDAEAAPHPWLTDSMVRALTARGEQEQATSAAAYHKSAVEPAMAGTGMAPGLARTLIGGGVSLLGQGALGFTDMMTTAPFRWATQLLGAPDEVTNKIRPETVSAFGRALFTGKTTTEELARMEQAKQEAAPAWLNEAARIAGELPGLSPVGLGGKVFQAVAAPATAIGTEIVGNIAAKLGEKLVERGALTAETLAQAQEGGTFVKTLTQALAKDSKIQAAALRMAAKYGPQALGTAAGFGGVRFAETGGDLPSALVASVPGLIMPWLSKLAEKGEEAIIDKLGDNWVSKVGAKTAAGVIEGTGFTLTDVGFLGDMAKAVFHGDVSGVGDALTRLTGSWVGMALSHGLTPSQYLQWRRENPEADRLLPQTFATLMGSEGVTTGQTRVNEARKATVEGLVRQGWTANIAPETPDLMELRLAGVKGTVRMERDPEGGFTVTMSPEQAKIAEVEPGVALRGEDAGKALDRLHSATVLSNAISHAAFGGTGEEAAPGAIFTDGMDRGVYRFGKYMRQAAGKSMGWEEAPSMDEHLQDPLGQPLVLDPHFGKGVEMLRHLVEAAAKIEVADGATKASNTQDLAEALTQLLEKSTVERGLRSRAHAEAIDFLTDKAFHDAMNSVTDKDKLIAVRDQVVKELGGVLSGERSARRAAQSMERWKAETGFEADVRGEGGEASESKDKRRWIYAKKIQDAKVGDVVELDGDDYHVTEVNRDYQYPVIVTKAPDGTRRVFSAMQTADGTDRLIFSDSLAHIFDKSAPISTKDMAGDMAEPKGMPSNAVLGTTTSQDVGRQPLPMHGKLQTPQGDLEPGDFSVRRSQIVKQLEKLSGSPINSGVGSFGRRQAEAWFDTKTEAIRSKYPLDIVSDAHETGHALQKRLEGSFTTSFGPTADAELETAGRNLYGSRVLAGGDYKSEGYAEYVARKLLGDATVDAEMPAFAQHITSRLARNPKVEKFWNKAADMFRDWREQGAAGRMRSGIHMEGDTKEPVSLKDRFEKIWQEYRQVTFDNLAKLKDNEAKLWAQNDVPFQKVSPDMSAYKTARALMMNSTGQSANAILNHVPDLTGRYRAEGLRQAFKGQIAHSELAEFYTYAVAKRGLDIIAKAEKRIQEIMTDPKADPVEAKAEIEALKQRQRVGFSEDDMSYVANDLQNPRFDKAIEAWSDWHDNLLRYNMDARGATEKQFQKIAQSEDFYFTWKRKFDELNEGASLRQAQYGGKSLLGGKGVVKGWKGSTREIEDPLVTSFNKATEVFTKSNKLLIQKAFHDMIKANEGSGWLGQVVDGPAPGQENIISLVVDGKDVHMQVHPDVAVAFKGMDAPHVEFVTDMLKGFTKAVKFSATATNVGFSIGQVWLDAIDAYTTSRVGEGLTRLIPRAPLTRGIVDQIAYALKTGKGGAVTGRGSRTEQFKGLGGDVATWIGSTHRNKAPMIESVVPMSAQEQLSGAVHHPIDAIKEAAHTVARSVERYLGVQEKAGRISEFGDMQAQIARQHPDWTDKAVAYEAMIAGKDITIDFPRMGTLTATLNPFMAYLGAGAGGISKVGRAFFTGENGNGQLVANWARAIGAISVPSLVLWWLNKDDKEYNSLSPDERAKYFHVPIATPMGKFIRLKRPDGILGDIFSRLIDGAASMSFKNDPKPMTEFMGNLITSLSPWLPVVQDEKKGMGVALGPPHRLIPNVLTPFLEVWLGKDLFTGGDIETSAMKRDVPALQAKPYTTQMAKALGDSMGLTPARWDILFRDTVGSLPLNVFRLWDMVTGAVADDPHRYPVLGRFFINPPTGHGQQVTDVYDQHETLAQRVHSGIATEDEKVEAHQLAQDIHAMKQWRDMEKLKTATHEDAMNAIQAIADRAAERKQKK